LDARDDWKRAAKIVGDTIRRWDPYGLLSLGAPQDEFDTEILAVVKEVPRIRSEDDAARILSRVFAGAFDDTQFAQSACSKVGAELFQKLRDADLLNSQ